MTSNTPRAEQQQEQRRQEVLHAVHGAGGPVIKAVGIGGAGSNAISHMAQRSPAGIGLVALHSNSQILDLCDVPDRVLFGSKLLRGLGAGGDPALGRAAAEEDLEQLRPWCQGADLVFVIAGLGGGTGTGAAPVIARAAKESGALVMGVVTTPFGFEGAWRLGQAEEGLVRLKEVADAVICLSNEKVFKAIDENTSMLEAFSMANDLLVQGVRGVQRMFTRRGLIHVDFADLCTIVRGRHSESAFASAEACGEGRSKEVIAKLMASPLLDGGQVLAEADALLVSLAGGTDLTTGDVNRVMEQIHRQAERAHVIFGTAVSEEFDGRLEVTLVASKHAKPGPEAQRSGAPGKRTELPVPASLMEAEIDSQFFEASPLPRPASRFVAPPPELTPERAQQLFSRPGSLPGGRKGAGRLKQGQLALEIISKGRFEKSEPTIHRGEDLDVPTYVRRGVPLN